MEIGRNVSAPKLPAHVKDAMRIAIINQHSDNFGDHLAAVTLLRRINATFPEATTDVIYTHHPWQTIVPLQNEQIRHSRLMTGDPISRREALITFMRVLAGGRRAFRDGRFHCLMETLDAIDEVIVSPCGANIGVYQDWTFLFALVASIHMRKRVTFHLNSIGPSGDWRFDMVALWVLRRATVYVRNLASARWLRSKSIVCGSGPDSAFAEPLWSMGKIASRDDTRWPQPYLALVPTDLAWHPKFKDAAKLTSSAERIVCANVAQFCKESQLQVRIIKHQTGSIDDHEVGQRYRALLLEAGLSHDQVIIDPAVDNVFGYVTAIRDAHVVLAMRYHAAIVGAMAGVPTVSIGYEEKMREAALYTGSIDCYLDIGSGQLSHITRLLKDVHARRSDFARMSRERLSFLTALAQMPLSQMWFARYSSK